MFFTRVGSGFARGWLGDAQDAANLGGRREAVLDGRAGAFPAIDHAGGDGGLLELADVGRGQDGPGELVGVGQKQLGQDGAAG